MGSPISPIVAELFLQILEMKIIHQNRDIRFWRRFVDDAFIIAKGRKLKSILDKLNNFNPAIEFTLEEEKNGKLAFLDTMLYDKIDGKIGHYVHRKPTDTNKYLDYQSFHPNAHKIKVRFGILVISGGSCVYVIYSHVVVSRPGFNLGHVAQYVIVIIVVLLVTGITFCILVIGEGTVTLVNYLLLMYNELNKLGQRTHGEIFRQTERKGGRNKILDKLCIMLGISGIRTETGRLDMTGILYLSVFIGGTATLYIIGPSALIQNFDVVNFVLSDIWSSMGISENGFVQLVLTVPLRLVLVLIFWIELQRTLPFLVYLLILPGQVVIRSIDIFLSHAKQSVISPIKITLEWILHYKRLQMLNTTASGYLATMIFVLMAVILQLSAGLNFATIRLLGYGMNPLYYAIFPCFGMLTLLAVKVVLHVAAGVNTNYHEFLDLWKHGSAQRYGGRNNYTLKTLKAMPALRVYAGLHDTHFFKLDKTVIRTFMSSIIDWTITLLMTFPVDEFYVA
ncbi:hypothetical protein Fcan01_24023 [Folsomia candida]|uniref:Reverse transcriptase domain-containing protein n=1 Tax=Folsomia candida TaxID=158441 RepID=A0A226DAA5_FOLCA|nr:hypothetical protein Fcan01_24023 [Folsomia candida]